MKRENRNVTLVSEGVYSEFMLNDLELGLLNNEVYNASGEDHLKLIVFNRLEMILELNRKLFAN